MLYLLQNLMNFLNLLLGMVAALTPLPVIGVPVRASALDGMDSLLSIVQVLQNFFNCST